MAWTKVRFRRHSGKTLPQILWSDPDWFFWAIEDDAFENKGVLQLEAQDLDYKARNIKIPNNDDGALVVEYFIHQPTGKFSHFEIVPADRPSHEGISRTFRTPLIDMSVPRRIAEYDKLGGKELISSLKFYIFGSHSVRLTKKKCGDFFNDPSYFA